MSKPTLSFQDAAFQMAALGPVSPLPDLLPDSVLQHAVAFHLEEDDEIYEGYGKRKNAYPYTAQNAYTRTLHTRSMSTAVLENQYLKAVFLPELGGRLWSLTDKATGENLLYTNDVIRFSNLAVRNAWFSGGVEWNIGVIGHTPLTNEPLFTARLQNEAGEPVLRMYGYERVRGVAYQMDFWLGEEDAFLNCRMRIVNEGPEVQPMYWWSNMAVPEYEEGRIVVPATHAYTCPEPGVCKVEIPVVNGVDVSYYKDIPRQVDYFFPIPQDKPKYIANLDKNGYGLLHLSTGRLQSRKLFSWGNNDGSDRWQEFLTEKAGRYVEIQAGLAKTQYGCLPMAPSTAWEWVEQYGPVQISREERDAPFQDLRQGFTTKVKQIEAQRKPEEVLRVTKNLAKTPAAPLQKGSGFGALENVRRKSLGLRPLSGHLDFSLEENPAKMWMDFLETGKLPDRPTDVPPGPFVVEDAFYSLLRQSLQGANRGNWLAHYHYGVQCAVREEYDPARTHLQTALSLAENPWAHHALAAVCLLEVDGEEAAAHACKALALRKGDVSLAKECMRILERAEAWQALREQYEALPPALQAESRLRYYYIEALHKTGNTARAYELLCEPGYELADIREGDTLIGKLWSEMHEALYGEKLPPPHRFNFNSL